MNSLWISSLALLLLGAVGHIEGRGNWGNFMPQNSQHGFGSPPRHFAQQSSSMLSTLGTPRLSHKSHFSQNQANPMFQTHQKSSYETPQQHAYGAPQKPAYEQPQKSFEPQQPRYQAPQKSSFQAPQKLNYGAPQKSYAAPQKSYQQSQKSAYQQPQKSYEPPRKLQQPSHKKFAAPQKPSYGASPSYQSQEQYEYSQKSYGSPQLPETQQQASGECLNLEDGDYPNPQETCSNYYLSCSGGETHWRTCPKDLYFDQETGTCGATAYVRDCGGNPSASTTAEPSTPSLQIEAEPPVDCFGQPNGNFENPMNPCDAIYFTCDNGNALTKECPPGTYYDQSRDMCDFAEFVVACGGFPTEPTEAPPAAPTTPKRGPRFDCSGYEDGNFPDPTTPCSDIFITCNGGEDNVRDCPSGTRYAVETDMCLEPAYVPACGGYLTTPAPVDYPTEATPHPLFDCTMQPNQNFPDPQQQCSATFIACNGGKTFVRYCPGALVYDRERDMCDYPNYIVECGGSPTVPPTTEAPLRIQNDNGYVYDCTGHEPGNYPDPQNQCSGIYYTCQGDLEGVMRECSPGTYYDEELDMCVFYKDHPICSGTPRTAVETTTLPMAPPRAPPKYPPRAPPMASHNYQPRTPPRAPPKAPPRAPPMNVPEVDCSNYPDGNFAPPGQCPHYFIKCSYGVGRKIECPSGYAYSGELGICIQMDRVAGCDY